MLPAGFEELERFVGRWDRMTIQQRWDNRSEASMQDIREFYEAATPLADAALAHVEKYPLNDLPPPEAALFRLLLSLSHASMAIEVHGQERAPNSPWPHGIRVVSAPAPFA
jgi:hypothetical protein